MEVNGSALEKATKYQMTIGISDFVDIIIVAYLLYKFIWLARKSNFSNVAKGIVLIIVCLWLSEVLNLTMINYLLRKVLELGLIALLIIFQPELRRLLERLGSTFSNGKALNGTAINDVITQTVNACMSMSETHTGALIIFERSVSLTHIISNGTIINSDVSAELLKNIFFKNAPLHDGAVIIRNMKIAAAGCVLPLTDRTNLNKELGTRHKAGIGMSEKSDAVVVIVSEETGAVSVAIDGMLKRHLTEESLSCILHTELVKEQNEDDKHDIITHFKNFFKEKNYEEDKRDEKTV